VLNLRAGESVAQVLAFPKWCEGISYYEVVINLKAVLGIEAAPLNGHCAR
jgi:hypothetical protein